MLLDIWASFDGISLNFDVWAVPPWGNKNTQRKRNGLLTSNDRVTDLKTTRATGRNPWVFSQRWRPEDMTFVKCGLVYLLHHYLLALFSLFLKTFHDVDH